MNSVSQPGLVRMYEKRKAFACGIVCTHAFVSVVQENVLAKCTIQKSAVCVRYSTVLVNEVGDQDPHYDIDQWTW